MLLRRWGARAPFAASVLLFGLPAAAEPTTHQCITASESGQDLEREGKLKAAIEHFELCSEAACPEVIREDCIRRRDEARHAQPTIELSVMDAEGHAVPAVELRIDDVVVAGTSRVVVVDPGEHQLHLRAPGFIGLTKTYDVRSGVRLHEDVLMQRSKVSSDHSRWSGDNQRMLAYVLASAGVVGIGVGSVLGLIAKSTYSDATSRSNCPGGLSACHQAGVDGVDRAHMQAAVSTVAFVAGSASLVGGVIFFATAPRDRGVTIQTRVGPSYASVFVAESW